MALRKPKMCKKGKTIGVPQQGASHREEDRERQVEIGVKRKNEQRSGGGERQRDPERRNQILEEELWESAEYGCIAEVEGFLWKQELQTVNQKTRKGSSKDNPGTSLGYRDKTEKRSKPQNDYLRQTQGRGKITCWAGRKEACGFWGQG